MKTKLHRIGIVVKDLDASISLYEKLLGVTFHRAGEAVVKEAGVHVAASWEAGVELVRPVPGSANPIARQMESYLQTHGDGGVFAVGYRTDDVDAALVAAEKANISKLLPTFKFSQEQLDHEFHGAFTRFEETALDTYADMGYLFAYNVIEDAKQEDACDVVRRWWAAMEKGDLEMVANMLTDDMVWEVLNVDGLMPKTIFRGKAEVVSELLPFYTQTYDVKTVRFDIDNMFAAGPDVVMEFTINATTGLGRPYVNAKYVSIIKVEAGRIRLVREYVDGLKAKVAHFNCLSNEIA